MEYGEQMLANVGGEGDDDRTPSSIATEGPPTYMLSFVGNDLSELATSYLRK